MRGKRARKRRRVWEGLDGGGGGGVLVVVWGGEEEEEEDGFEGRSERA